MSTDIETLLPNLPYCSDFHAAVRQAKPGDTLLCLHNGCSSRTITEDILNSIREKQLNVYLEMPEGCATSTLEPSWRCITTTRFANLEAKLIMTPHCTRLADAPLKGDALLIAARVAGYDTAVFGLPPERKNVVVIHEGCPNFIVSLLPLSDFLRGRFAPFAHWIDFWNGVLSRLGLDERLPKDIRPAVDTRYLPDDALPPSAVSSVSSKGRSLSMRFVITVIVCRA